MKSAIFSPQAPAPIGPYAQAVKAGNMLFVSGQIAIDPGTKELVLDSIQQETLTVMNNIKVILEEARFTFADVVKVSIFLSDMKHFAEVNEVYGSFFGPDFPARETVAVAGLPRNVNVEISVTAYRA